jgi:hypothetical protein
VSPLLRVLEDLLCRIYDRDELAVDRIAAAERWWRLVQAQRPPGVPHYEPHADPDLEAHENKHAPHVLGVTIRKCLGTPIEPGEKLHPWAGHPPRGWRPREAS